jgi:hypothetical protein
VFSPIRRSPRRTAIHRADERSRLPKLVEVRDDDLLVRQRAIKSNPPHRYGPAYRIREYLSSCVTFSAVGSWSCPKDAAVAGVGKKIQRAI